jgi:hypothetical protein
MTSSAAHAGDSSDGYPLREQLTSAFQAASGNATAGFGSIREQAAAREAIGAKV